MISIWDVFKYIYKWKILILALILVFFFGAQYYINSNQMYSAEIIIKYIDETAPEGTTINGYKIDPYEIMSPKIISGAIEDLGIKADVEGIRGSMVITPLIPQDKQDLKEQMIKDSKELEYFPTSYSVKYTAGNDQNGTYARDILDAVISRYCTYFSEQYLNQETVADTEYQLDNENRDYMFIAEDMDEKVINVTTFLNEKSGLAPTFRSAKTGLCFSDLVSEYNNIQFVKLPILFTDILSNHVTQNSDVLIKKYKFKSDNLILSSQSSTKQADDVLALMEQYAKNDRDSVYPDEQYDSDNSKITEVVDDIDASRSKTTYDNLVENYVKYGVDASNNTIDADYCDTIIGYFSKATDSQPSDLTNNIETQIKELKEQFNDLYQKTVITLSDYNNFAAMNSVAILSGIGIYGEVASRLYVLLSIVVGLCLGIIIAIAIEIIKKVSKERTKQTAENEGDDEKSDEKPTADEETTTQEETPKEDEQQ